MSYTKIDNFLWEVEYYLMRRYGCSTAEREVYPLRWYIHTGRAPVSFLTTMLMAKPYVIARVLHMGGSDEEIIGRVKAKLNISY